MPDKWWVPTEFKEIDAIQDPEKRKEFARKKLASTFKDQFINSLPSPGNDKIEQSSNFLRYIISAWQGKVKLGLLGVLGFVVGKIFDFIATDIPALEWPIIVLAVPCAVWYSVSLWRCAFNGTGRRWAGWTLRVFQVIGLFSIVIAGSIQAMFYLYTLPVTQCSAFASDPKTSVKACTNLLQKSQQHPERKTIAEPAYVVTWLHLAYLHAGIDDQKDFERNSTPYLNDKWPSPIIALYLGRTTVEDVYAKAKSIASVEKIGALASSTNNPECEASFYIGEWYLAKNMRNEAGQALQAAKSSCNSKQVEWQNIQTDLKTLGYQ